MFDACPVHAGDAIRPGLRSNKHIRRNNFMSDAHIQTFTGRDRGVGTQPVEGSLAADDIGQKGSPTTVRAKSDLRVPGCNAGFALRVRSSTRASSRSTSNSGTSALCREGRFSRTIAVVSETSSVTSRSAMCVQRRCNIAHQNQRPPACDELSIGTRARRR